MRTAKRTYDKGSPRPEARRGEPGLCGSEEALGGSCACDVGTAAAQDGVRQRASSRNSTSLRRGSIDVIFMQEMAPAWDKKAQLPPSEGYEWLVNENSEGDTAMAIKEGVMGGSQGLRNGQPLAGRHDASRGRALEHRQLPPPDGVAERRRLAPGLRRGAGPREEGATPVGRTHRRGARRNEHRPRRELLGRREAPGHAGHGAADWAAAHTPSPRDRGFGRTRGTTCAARSCAERSTASWRRTPACGRPPSPRTKGAATTRCSRSQGMARRA